MRPRIQNAFCCNSARIVGPILHKNQWARILRMANWLELDGRTLAANIVHAFSPLRTSGPVGGQQRCRETATARNTQPASPARLVTSRLAQERLPGASDTLHASLPRQSALPSDATLEHRPRVAFSAPQHLGCNLRTRIDSIRLTALYGKISAVDPQKTRNLPLVHCLRQPTNAHSPRI